MKKYVSNKTGQGKDSSKIYKYTIIQIHNLAISDISLISTKNEILVKWLVLEGLGLVVLVESAHSNYN